MAEGPGDNRIQATCRCPCGRMDFSHIVEPPPRCWRDRHTNFERFAELDLDSDPVKDELRELLIIETEELYRKFAEYRTAVFKYAKSVHEIEPILRQIALGLEQPIDDDMEFHKLYETATIKDDFLNYEMIERIVRECDECDGNVDPSKRDAAEQAQQAYINALEKFAKLRAFKVLRPVQVGAPETLHIKVEENLRECITNKGLEKLKRKLKTILNLDKDVSLLVKDVLEGCVEVTFEITGKVSEEQFNLQYTQKKILASNKISMLEYAGKVYYCCCELMPDDENVVEQLYSSVIKGTTSLSMHPATKGRGKHSPNCSYIQDIEKKCPTERCTYCGIEFNFCTIEFHVNTCGKPARETYIKMHMYRNSTGREKNKDQHSRDDLNAASPILA